ncbi:putative Histidine kinase [Candidatus Sulfopaludibacter sp. SbA3]|nr:putative Histidine kinase [Candidatus Sulfopaludibacter sp. SbA3]
MSSAGNSAGEYERQLLDELPAMLWTSGPDSGTGHWNAMARKWFGIPPEQSCGPLTDRIHADDREAAVAQWEQAISTGGPLSATFRARAASGEWRWLALSGTLRRDGWACSLTDIHDYNEGTRLLDGLLQHIPLALVIADAPDGRLRKVSRYREQLAGAGARSGIGVPADQHPTAFRISHPDGRAALPSELPLARALQGEIVQGEEWRYTRADGERIAVLSSAAPIRNGQGRITGGLAFWHDITYRKAAEEEFYETSQRLKMLIGSSPLAVIEWDPDRRITGWMGHSEAIFGWSAAEVTGKRLDEFGLIYPDDRNMVREAIDALKSGVSNIVRNRNYRKDGSLLYCEWYNSALVDQSGCLVWGLSLALDVTARHWMEEALRTSEEKFRSIVEAAPVGIFQSAVEGRFLSANSKLAHLYRYDSPEELIRSVNDIADELFVKPEKRQQILRRAQESGEFVQDEVEYRCRDGARFLSNLHIRMIRRAGGEPVLEGFVEDITERKRAEEALREAHSALERRVEERTAELSAANERLTELDRLKSQFLASMSHELRTPLNSIIGFTSLLRRGLTGPVNEEQLKQLGIVQTSAAHLLALINDLLDVSRIEAGRADLLHEPFDFVEVVHEVVRSLQPMADRKSLAVVVDVPEPAIAMRGDRKRSLQVLLNLVTNALKFTEHGTVTVAAASAGNLLRVEVADTGIGIRPEHLAMLFEAFRQVDGSAKRVYEGAGLGLYLCRKLLTLMGGEIRAESDYGKGSRFLYAMPLELRE